MNSKMLAGLGLAALLASPAAAADMSYPAPAAYAAPAPVFTWTGFYLGGNLGYGWGTADFSGDTDGFIGGLQAGYNYQTSGPLVIGVETDIQGTNIGSSTYEFDYLGTLRLRAGFTVDQFLLYGTGGFAYGRAGYELAGLTSKQTSTGWTIGGGAEYAIDANWSAKAEYLYVDLGDETYTTIAGPRNVGSTTNLLRLGANYRF
ncbi:outer membrane beta-barrel protein [Ancylobacter sp. A5.8]|uniref:outer membrane protein n=1 Tax=Ancylobacter gelatini TaxID=2919920 RepID=UPI001F4EA44F|nr:outer membrane beta-barrel protein [Ancylobacter gelatini]MCJ8142354.1 outer membrane beta-barrel protein [Ancylobacter gelatini]